MVAIPSEAVPQVPEAKSPLHAPALHESGLKHTSGEALYVDDAKDKKSASAAALCSCAMRARDRIAPHSPPAPFPPLAEKGGR